MDTGLQFLKYLELQGELVALNKAQFLMPNTACAEVLWDAIRMFAPTKIEQNSLFCDTAWGKNLVLKLGVKELQELVQSILNLTEDFHEADYIKYIIRKIFARYQEEGKINLSICYN